MASFTLFFLLNIPVPLKRNTFQVPLDLNVFHIYTKMNRPDVNTQHQTLYFFTLKLSQITWHSDHILSTKWQDKDTSIQFKYIYFLNQLQDKFIKQVCCKVGQYICLATNLTCFFTQLHVNTSWSIVKMILLWLEAFCQRNNILELY